MYLAHGPISYIVNETIQKERISKLKPSEQFLVGILSFLFGILPDIDLLILSMTNVPSFLHHSLFTHSVVLYIVMWLLLNLTIFLLKRVLNKKGRTVLNDELLDVIQLSFLIGVMSHLFADVLFSYSRILFPVESQVTLLGNIFKTNYFASYIFNPTFPVELLLVGIFFLMVYKKYFKHREIVPVLIYFLMGISTIFFIFSCYMNLNTYNMASHFENGSKIYDTDFDGVMDKYDSDVGNLGKNNILRVDSKEMVYFVEEISTNKYLVTNNSSRFTRISSYWGGFDSYRVISQAFFEQNLPIEPVLREYAQVTYGLKGYKREISYSQLLYEYISTNWRKTQLDTPGGMIFVTNNEGELVNTGIVVNNRKVSLVLSTDKRLVLHDLDKIVQKYEGMGIRAFVLP